MKFKNLLLVFSLFVFSMLAVTAFSEATCSDSVCPASDEISFHMNQWNLEIQSPTGVLVSEKPISPFVSQIWYDFEISYSARTGIYNFIVDGINLSYEGVSGRGYETLSLVTEQFSPTNSMFPIDGIVMEGVKLNNISLLDFGITNIGNQKLGLIVNNIIPTYEGLLVSGRIKMTISSANGLQTKPFSNVFLGSSINVTIPDVILEAGLISEFEISVLDEEITTELGGLHVKILQHTNRFLMFGNLVVWNETNSDYVSDFTIVSFLTNGEIDLQNLVLGNLFEATELITIGNTTAIWETYNVNDSIRSGFQTASISGENLMLLPEGDFSVYYII